MANGKGMLPRPGMPPLLNQIRPGRPELPADWAALSDEEIRERLSEMGYSNKMIEDELGRYRKYREAINKTPPDIPSEPKPKSDFLDDIGRTVKGGE